MYDHFNFDNPPSMDTDQSAVPRWLSPTVLTLQNKRQQTNMAGYFGMVKCIDDNVGKLLGVLEEQVN